MEIDLSPTHLRRLLEDLDLPNKEAADYCGVAQSSMYRWLGGEAPIPASVIRMFQYRRELASISRQAAQSIGVTA